MAGRCWAYHTVPCLKWRTPNESPNSRTWRGKSSFPGRRCQFSVCATSVASQFFWRLGAWEMGWLSGNWFLCWLRLSIPCETFFFLKKILWATVHMEFASLRVLCIKSRPYTPILPTIGNRTAWSALEISRNRFWNQNLMAPYGLVTDRIAWNPAVAHSKSRVSDRVGSTLFCIRQLPLIWLCHSFST